MADPRKENQEKDQQMDEMLDSLLANYSSAEPRPGLETRILANLRGAGSREASAPAWNFKWLWTAAAAAAAIIVAALLIGGRRHVTAPTPAVVQTQQPAPRQTEAQTAWPRTAPNPVRHDRKATVPARPQDDSLALNQRPAFFPTPVALSEQEKLMFAYLENTPREVVIAQIPRNDDQQESEAFWADREPSSGTRRSTNTR